MIESITLNKMVAHTPADYLSKLTRDLFLLIFNRVEFCDQQNLAKTCQTFRLYATDERAQLQKLKTLVKRKPKLWDFKDAIAFMTDGRSLYRHLRTTGNGQPSFSAITPSSRIKYQNDEDEKIVAVYFTPGFFYLVSKNVLRVISRDDSLNLLKEWKSSEFFPHDDFGNCVTCCRQTDLVISTISRSIILRKDQKIGEVTHPEAIFIDYSPDRVLLGTLDNADLQTFVQCTVSGQIINTLDVKKKNIALAGINSLHILIYECHQDNENSTHQSELVVYDLNINLINQFTLRQIPLNIPRSLWSLTEDFKSLVYEDRFAYICEEYFALWNITNGQQIKKISPTNLGCLHQMEHYKDLLFVTIHETILIMNFRTGNHYGTIQTPGNGFYYLRFEEEECFLLHFSKGRGDASVTGTIGLETEEQASKKQRVLPELIQND